MKKFIRFTGIVLCLAVIAGSLYGAFHRQQILDYVALRGYTPGDRIVALADETTMNDATRKVFYVNRPELSDRTSFGKNCPSTSESIVLGCYVQRKGIFLFNVTDSRLEGVIQVTAAHETLHAEYDRLNSKERARVDQMTNAYFQTLNNDRIKKTIEQYRSKDPSIVPNELHSILGTEVRDLSPELETYYSQYFNNRKQIVDYSEKYEDTFVGLADQVANYDKQLASLKQTISANQVEIDGQSTDIDAGKARLDALLSANKTEQYNAAVPEFNAQVNQYNALISRTKELIDQHNDIVEKRNAIATTEQELVQAINSNSITPQQTE